jgi:hypothetical protein
MEPASQRRFVLQVFEMKGSGKSKAVRDVFGV